MTEREQSYAFRPVSFDARRSLPPSPDARKVLAERALARGEKEGHV